MALLTPNHNESIAVYEANRTVAAQRYGLSSANELWLVAINAMRRVYTEKELRASRGQGAYSRLAKWIRRAELEFAEDVVQFNIPGAHYQSRANVEDDVKSGMLMIPLDKIGEVQAYFYDGMLAEKD